MVEQIVVKTSHFTGEASEVLRPAHISNTANNSGHFTWRPTLVLTAFPASLVKCLLE
jgi:hypothetical protein